MLSHDEHFDYIHCFMKKDNRIDIFLFSTDLLLLSLFCNMIVNRNITE